MRAIIPILFLLFTITLQSQTYKTLKEKNVTLLFEGLSEKTVGNIKLYIKKVTKKSATKTKVKGGYETYHSTKSTFFFYLKNKSCIGVQYKTSLRLKSGDIVRDYDYNGTLKGNQEILLKRYINSTGRSHSVSIPSFSFTPLYSNGDKILYSIGDSSDRLLNDSKLLKCVGKTKEQYQRDVNRAIKKQQDLIEKYRQQDLIEKEKKKKEEALKERLWKESGIDKHLEHYSKNKVNGLYNKVPYDILENIAKHSNKPLLIINLGPKKYKKGLLKLTPENIAFLEEKVIAMTENHSSGKFWKWVKLKKLKIRSSPVFIIKDIDGKTSFSGYKFNTDFINNISTFLTDFAKKTK